MSSKLTLKVVAVMSFIGMVFSGVLSYKELYKSTCNVDEISCNDAGILEMPACVYGCIMYTIIFMLVTICLLKNSKQTDA